MKYLQDRNSDYYKKFSDPNYDKLIDKLGVIMFMRMRGELFTKLYHQTSCKSERQLIGSFFAPLSISIRKP